MTDSTTSAGPPAPGGRLISADSHLDLPWIPPDLWQRELPAPLRERGPKVVDVGEGPAWFWEDTTRAPSATGSNNALFLTEFFGKFGIECPPASLPPSDPDLILAHLDLGGVAHQIVFPPVNGLWFDDDQLRRSAVRVYNEFVFGLGQRTGGRLVPLAVMPNRAPDDCVREARWAAKHGFRGLEFNALLAAEPLWSPIWDEFLDTVEELGLPLCMHISDTPGVQPVKRHGQWPVHVVEASFAVVRPILELLFSGALDRRPDLRVLLGECRIGWIPFVLQQADEAARERDTDVRLTRLPSEIWRQQIAATFEADQVGGRLLAQPWSQLAGSVMWANDYPHNSTMCFNPQPVLDELFDGVPAQFAESARHGLAAQWFGLQEQ
jgi:predicted TIM-barrel fold metal-dependent hydrolase